MTEDSGNTDETLVNLLREERDNWRRLAEARQETVDRLRGERDLAKNRLLAAIIMHETLIRARDKFREYTTSHLSKGTADGNQKAHTNTEMAMICDNAIHAWEKSRG